MIRPATMESLERKFELDTDQLDARLMNNELTQKEYDGLSRKMAQKFEADVDHLTRAGRV